MSTLRNTLDSLLRRNNDYCCLCLNTIHEQPFNCEDVVAVNIHQEEKNMSVSEVLLAVLGDKVSEYLQTFQQICPQCIVIAIQCYTFANVCLSNSERLTNFIHSLYDTFEHVDQELTGCKSLYVSVNSEDFSGRLFYDNRKQVNSVALVHRRFCSMLNTNTQTAKVKPKQEMKKYPEVTRKEDDNKQQKQPRKKKCSIPIKTSEMIYDINDPILKCKECLKIFPLKYLLRNHYIRMHAPKMYQCQKCPRKFASPAYLEVHNSESHCNIICSHCGKCFNNKHTFKTHENSHLVKYVCQDCGRVYKSHTSYKRHKEHNVCGQQVRASPSNAKFTCDYCGKKYTQKVSLRVHIQYEHGNYKAHVCEFCNKKFWAISRLKAHMVKHTKERNFACEYCDGKFVSRESLLYHTRIHTGDKPYKCNHCNALFVSSSRKTEHMKRQHTNAFLECNICGSKFSSQNFLNKHKKTHAESISEPEVSKIVSSQKVDSSDFKQLTQDLKRMESQEYSFETEQTMPEEHFHQIKLLTSNDNEYVI